MTMTFQGDMLQGETTYHAMESLHGETTHRAIVISMGGEVILWKKLQGETLPGEMLHHAMATLQGETSVEGDVDGGRRHGVRGHRLRC